MTNSQLLTLALLFVLIFGIALLAMLLLTRNPITARLSALDESDTVERRRGQSWRAHLARLAAPLAKLSVPAEGWESSPVRLRFINAGWRDPATPGLFHGGKTAFAIGLPLLAWLVLRQDPERAFGITFLGLVSAARVVSVRPWNEP